MGVSEARTSILEQLGLAASQFLPIQAIVDTGSTTTAVDPSILEKLDLTPTGRTPLIIPGKEPVFVEQYDVSLVIQSARKDQPPLIISTLPAICVELLDNQGFHALIGRDILSHCVFYYNGSIGLFTLSY